MTETGLLIAQGVVILLLYLLVWTIVRSSSRELRDAEALQAPPAVHAAAEAAEMATPDPAVAEPAVPEPTPATLVAAAAPTDTAAGVRRERPGPALDLSANIHPRLVVESSPGIEPGLEVELTSGMTIGRGPHNGLSIPDAFVSHMHARIFRRGQFLVIEDLGSTNGTFVNERRIDPDAQLKVRDEIRIGETILRYEE